MFPGRKFVVAVVHLTLVVALYPGFAWATPPKNVIILIGDGMGFEHVKAASIYASGAEGTLSFEQLPYQGQVITNTVSGGTTDSAAAATAMATGHKVIAAAISTAQPPPAGSGLKWGDPMTTMLEILMAQGKSSGLVSTAQITDATPAAFGAHAMTRSQRAIIANGFLTQNKVNVILGGGDGGYITNTMAQAAGYTTVANRTQLQAVNTQTTTYLTGIFGNDALPYEANGLGALPHLSEMATTAIDILDNDPQGFFLMIEGGRIDHAAHANNIAQTVLETVEFSNTVQLVLNWAAGRTDTLVLVTADHETGGLHVLANLGQDVMPTVSWSSTEHTSTKVPVYAWGVNAQMVSGIIDNTDIFNIALAPEPASVLMLGVGIVAAALRRQRR
ncbi:MAG: alkaline phosphatase [Phycisphaeraceae bacterium]|nr:alkaline phosphatase [Phycisphaeraceae bacterium]